MIPSDFCAADTERYVFRSDSLPANPPHFLQYYIDIRQTLALLSNNEIFELEP